MTRPESLGSARGGPRNRALRLTFQYENRDVKLITVERLEMIAPPPQAVVPRREERGSWFELRDREGRPLYRRVIDNPMRYDVEVVADDSQLPLARVGVDQPRGTFFLIVPDIPLLRSLVLVTEPAPPPSGTRKLEAAPEAEVHEFDLSSIDQEER